MNKWLLAGVLIVQSLHVFSEVTVARVWLDKMSHSARELNYKGAFTYEQGDLIEALRISHAVFDGQEFERLERMGGGEPREIIRRGHNLECLHSGDHLLRIFKQNPSQGQGTAPLVELERFYHLSIVGYQRVAGHHAIELAIVPRDTHRFGHRLSLDEKTGLLLRSELYGPKNNVLERFQFVDVDIGVDIAFELFERQDDSYEAWHAADPSKTPTAKAVPLEWAVGWLPGGFQVVAGGGDVITYSDGLTVFSVFFEAPSHSVSIDGSASEGVAYRGATVAYSRAIMFNGVPRWVTVVGEIPQHTAELVAASVTVLDK